jgi:hypothetical protein
MGTLLALVSTRSQMRHPEGKKHADDRVAYLRQPTPAASGPAAHTSASRSRHAAG